VRERLLVAIGTGTFGAGLAFGREVFRAGRALRRVILAFGLAALTFGLAPLTFGRAARRAGFRALTLRLGRALALALARLRVFRPLALVARAFCFLPFFALAAINATRSRPVG